VGRARVGPGPGQAGVGEAQGEPWAEIPETFRRMTLPDRPVPTDLKRWQDVDRPRTREVLVKLLGAMPPRPDPAKVEVVAREEHDGHTRERFRFHNGVDEVVPGLLPLPGGRKGPAPAVVGMHGHGSNKENVLTNAKSSERVGPELARRGYVVAAIDSYFCGERAGKGPAGRLDRARPVGEEESLVKLNLLLGRTLGG